MKQKNFEGQIGGEGSSWCHVRTGKGEGEWKIGLERIGVGVQHEESAPVQKKIPLPGRQILRRRVGLHAPEDRPGEGQKGDEEKIEFVPPMKEGLFIARGIGRRRAQRGRDGIFQEILWTRCK